MPRDNSIKRETFTVQKNVELSTGENFTVEIKGKINLYGGYHVINCMPAQCTSETEIVGHKVVSKIKRIRVKAEEHIHRAITKQELRLRGLGSVGIGLALITNIITMTSLYNLNRMSRSRKS